MQAQILFVLMRPHGPQCLKVPAQRRDTHYLSPMDAPRARGMLTAHRVQGINARLRSEDRNGHFRNCIRDDLIDGNWSGLLQSNGQPANLTDWSDADVANLRTPVFSCEHRFPVVERVLSIGGSKAAFSSKVKQ
jgi:hypothetical protein